MGGAAKRTAHVEDAVALLQVFQHLGGTAQHQIHDGDSAVFLIGIGNGEGEAFAAFIDAEDDKMAGAGRGGYLRGIQNELAGAARDEHFLAENLGRHSGYLTLLTDKTV